MADLDDKLREILLAPYKYPKGDGATMFDDKGDIPILDTQIAQIKQAFAEAGYISHNSKIYWAKHDDKMYIVNGSDPIKRVSLSTLMTGQEWYDRFEKQVRKSPDVDDWHYTHLEVLEAAKKASGL